MKKLILSTLLIIPGIVFAQHKFTEKVSGTGFDLYYDGGDAAKESVQKYAQKGLTEISNFFNKPFKKRVDIYLFPNRSDLDAQWQSAWGMPGFKSQCWMVGSGILSRLDLLSPSAWEKEACEHDPDDQIEIERLVIHELVHVLHSDYNQSPAFDKINNIDWFVEGLATYASGQLDQERFEPMAKFVKAGKGPTQLANFWKGEHRYGLSGSIVQYIDETFGRTVLSELIKYSDVNDILRRIDLTEAELIEAWRRSITK